MNILTSPVIHINSYRSGPFEKRAIRIRVTPHTHIVAATSVFILPPLPLPYTRAQDKSADFEAQYQNRSGATAVGGSSGSADSDLPALPQVIVPVCRCVYESVCLQSVCVGVSVQSGCVGVSVCNLYVLVCRRPPVCNLYVLVCLCLCAICMCWCVGVSVYNLYVSVCLCLRRFVYA